MKSLIIIFAHVNTKVDLNEPVSCWRLLLSPLREVLLNRKIWLGRKEETVGSLERNSKKPNNIALASIILATDRRVVTWELDSQVSNGSIVLNT